ncbi:TPA: hypothetical protein ACMDU7_000544 [Vibrio parahaemolyticus]|nr:hypothetical protein [Vibrio parahaemolyticus]
MEREPTVNIDDFVNKLCSSVESLPTKELELCDLSNEIGIAIATLIGSKKALETEVIAGIRHGFDLVRIRSDQAEEDVELKELLDAKSVGKE